MSGTAKGAGNRERAKVTGRTAIVIDDGIPTGATTRAAVRAIFMRNPKRKRHGRVTRPIGPNSMIHITPSLKLSISGRQPCHRRRVDDPVAVVRPYT